MNDVANKLVGQFAANLATLLTSGDPGSCHPRPPGPGSLHAGTWNPGRDRSATTSGDGRGRGRVRRLHAARPFASRPPRLAAALILSDVFVLGWAIGRLGNRR